MEIEKIRAIVKEYPGNDEEREMIVELVLLLLKNQNRIHKYEKFMEGISNCVAC
jgi:hypothetical protein